jgi:hypothetical protein
MDTLNRSNTRKSLPLSERDLHDLALMRGSVAHRAALSRLADVDVNEDSSEAALLHAVMEAGIRAVAQQVEAAGYAELAAGMDTANRKSTARRRRPTWADE